MPDKKPTLSEEMKYFIMSCMPDKTILTSDQIQAYIKNGKNLFAKTFVECLPEAKEMNQGHSILVEDSNRNIRVFNDCITQAKKNMLEELK